MVGFHLSVSALWILDRVRLIDFYVCSANHDLLTVGWYLPDQKRSVNLDINSLSLYLSGQAIARNFEETLALVSDRARVKELGLEPCEEQRKVLRARHRNAQRSLARARARERAANAATGPVNNQAHGVPAAAPHPASGLRGSEPSLSTAAGAASGATAAKEAAEEAAMERMFAIARRPDAMQVIRDMLRTSDG